LRGNFVPNTFMLSSRQKVMRPHGEDSGLCGERTCQRSLQGLSFLDGVKRNEMPDNFRPRNSRRTGESALKDQISKFFTSSAFSSMNFLRASTYSPIGLVKMVSHSAISS